MGTNDHIPSKQQRTPSRRRSKTAELLDWSMANPDTLATLVGEASKAGAYIAFGATLPPTCLLLYIRHGDWKERVAIEEREDIDSELASLIAEFE